MKKAAIILSIILVLLVGGAAAVLCVNPSIVSQLAFFGTTETEPETQPTKPPETEPAKIKTLTISGKESLNKGDSEELTVKYTPTNAPVPKLSWQSSDDGVASVDDKGMVKAVAMGECEITATAADSNVKSVLKITVSDEDVEKINTLNSYLIRIPDSRLEKYDSGSSVMLTLKKAAIQDFNSDGTPELLLRLESASGYKFSVIVALDQYGNAYEIKNFSDYAEVFSAKYDSYEEELLLGDSGNIFIKTTAVKSDKKKKTRTRNVTVTTYTYGGLSYKNYFEDVYKYKDSELKTAEKGEFKIDGEKAEEAAYMKTLSSMTRGSAELDEKLIDRSETLIMGKFVKISPACELDSVYLDRIEWKSDKPEIAQVNDSGIVTGVRSGSCVVTGVMEGFDDAVARAVITVRESSTALSKYLGEVKGKPVTSGGMSLSYKGSMTADIDDDGTKELLLYYKSGARVQLDICEDKNGKVERTTAFSASSSSGDTDIQVFVNNASDRIVISENNFSYSSGAKGTLKFAFYEYDGENFEKSSSDYRVEYAQDDDDNKYYQDNNAIDKAEFERQTGHYSKYMDFAE